VHSNSRNPGCSINALCVLHLAFCCYKFRNTIRALSMLTRHFIRAHFTLPAALVPVHARAVANPALRPRSNRQRREMSRAASLRRAMKWRRSGREDLAELAHDSARCREIKYSATAGTLRSGSTTKDCARMFFVLHPDGET